MINENQKKTTQEYRDNYDRIFDKARKGKQAKPTQPHRDKTKYYRPVQGGGQVPE